MNHFERQIVPIRSTRRLLLLTPLALCSFLHPRAISSQSDPATTFSESLAVAEASVYVDTSGLPQVGSAFRNSPSDFLVRIGGNTADVVESGSVGAAEIAHVVWLDRHLASQAYIAGAANLLAKAIDTFPGSERIALVEIDQKVLSIQDRLSRSELLVRLRRLGSADSAIQQPRPTLAQRIEALNRLAIELPRQEEKDIGALWLIAEPWSVEAAEMEGMLRSEADEVFATSALGALQRTSRILAGYGWAIFPISSSEMDRPEEKRLSSQVVEWNEVPPGSGSPRFDEPTPILLRISRLFSKNGRKKRRTPAWSLARSLELATDIRLAPLALLARGSSGALAGDYFRVTQLAANLRLRRRLVVRDSTPFAASLRKVEVVWAGGDGRALPTLPWISYQAPAELGAARLLNGLGELDRNVGSPLRMETTHTAGGPKEAICFVYPSSRSSVRILWLKAASLKVEIGDVVVPSATQVNCAPVPNDLEDGDFLLLEAPDSTEWGMGQVQSLRSRKASTTGTASKAKPGSD